MRCDYRGALAAFFVAWGIACGGVTKYPEPPGAIGGLSLKGDGCRRDLISGDGRVLCRGVAMRLEPPRCDEVSEPPRTAADGRVDEGTHHLFGSECKPAPGMLSGHMGHGVFYLENTEGAWEVICDDAPESRVSEWEAARRACK